jgi:hypothetical protein
MRLRIGLKDGLIVRMLARGSQFLQQRAIHMPHHRPEFDLATSYVANLAHRWRSPPPH